MTRDQMRRSEVKSGAKHQGRRTDSQYNKYNVKGNTLSVWTSQTSESATRSSTVYSSITLSISRHRPLLLQKRPVSALLLLLSVGSLPVLSLASAIGSLNVTQSIANADSCCAKLSCNLRESYIKTSSSTKPQATQHDENISFTGIACCRGYSPAY